MGAASNRRVVVTGMGIVSCLGNDAASVTTALRESRPGIALIPEYAELGLRSQVAGVPDVFLLEFDEVGGAYRFGWDAFVA